MAEQLHKPDLGEWTETRSPSGYLDYHHRATGCGVRQQFGKRPKTWVAYWRDPLGLRSVRDERGKPMLFSNPRDAALAALDCDRRRNFRDEATP